MKRVLKTSALALIIVLCSSLPNPASAQYDDDYYDDDRDVSYQTFYDELSPHGRWVDYPGQGYVWVPDAGPDFRPYSTNGHWVWTDNYEWMWVSDYDWGWAPFHYGRWDNDPYYGWYWVPGYEWSPAWVAWRDGGDYYGWAPIRPGINISINFNIGGYSPPYDFWCFTPRRYITSRSLHSHYIDRRQNVTIINQTTIINNFNYGGNYGFRSGPRRMDAERYTGRINPVRFRNSTTPGRTQFRNNEVSVYRPSIRQNNNRSIAPRQFERYDRNNAATSRNDNGFRRNDNASNRGNNLPNRQQGDNTNRQFDRRNSGQNTGNNDIRTPRQTEQPNRTQPGNNRGFERRESTDRPVRNNDVRTPRQTEQPDRTQPGNNRGFERRESTDRPVRNNDVRTPQPVERTNGNKRQFERRSADNNNSNRTMDRPQPNREVRQQPSREMRQQPDREVRQQPTREMRQQPNREVRQQPQAPQRRVEEQPRSTERRSEGSGNRQQGNGNGGNKRRF